MRRFTLRSSAEQTSLPVYRRKRKKIKQGVSRQSEPFTDPLSLTGYDKTFLNTYVQKGFSFCMQLLTIITRLKIWSLQISLQCPALFTLLQSHTLFRFRSLLTKLLHFSRVTLQLFHKLLCFQLSLRVFSILRLVHGHSKSLVAGI